MFMFFDFIFRFLGLTGRFQAYSTSLNNHPPAPLGSGGGDGLALSWRLGVGMEILMAKMRRGGGWAHLIFKLPNFRITIPPSD